MMLGTIIAVLVGLTVIMFFVGLLLWFGREGETERLYEVVHADVAMDTAGSRVNLSQLPRSALKNFDSRLRNRGMGERLTASLIQADLKITATEYVLILIGVTCLGTLLGYPISRQPISGFVAGLIAFFIPGLVVKFRTNKRRNAFADQLVDALIQIIGSLRSGYSLLQAMDTVANQMTAPASEEFGRVVREVQLGQPLQLALAHLADRIKNDDLIMVIGAITTNQQVGGNLAEILEIVADTIRERVRIKREIGVLTAQQTISGYVLVFLPVALGALLMIINPEYQMRLFTPGITRCIPVGAGVGIICGYFLMRRIVDINV
jgi:tight adherence protein B